MTKKTNEARVQRQAKSDRNMNRAVVLLCAGLAAEWYLLMADRYFARGTWSQEMAWASFLEKMVWVGLAAFLAGAVLYAVSVLRVKKTWLTYLGGAAAGVGAFFCATSYLMRHVYPMGVTVLCVLVPVVLIVGIIWLFYQAEFTIQSMALAMAIGALVLLGRSYSQRVRACAVLALIGIAALAALTLLLSKNDGVLGKGGKRMRVVPAGTSYRLTLGVLALCFALVLVTMLSPAVAFYGTWALAIVAFVLAVYYTIKLM